MSNARKLSFEKCDAYIFITPAHRKYFTDFSSTFGYFIASEKFELFITDKRYEKASKDHFAKTKTSLEISASLLEILKKNAQLFAKENIKKIGFEEELTVGEFENLKSIFSEIGNFEFVNISNEILQMRAVKSEEEINKITHAMKISAKAYEEFLKTVQVGQTERELCANLNHQLFLQGADTLAFETIIASGENGAKPHATPGNRKIQSGDFVTCDFGGRVDGYNADITRTFAVGDVSKKQLEAYEIVKKAQEISLSKAVAGANAKDVHNTALEIIANGGYGEYFTHGLGHGVGVEIHEAPTLNPRSNEILHENNIVTIEPGVYIENEFGLRIEDTIVVKNGENINLNPLSKELITIKA